MRRKISSEVWQQVRTACAAGIGLREIARNMGFPEGTVLAKAKREGWTQQIQSAKNAAQTKTPALTVGPADAVARTMKERAERHVARMAGVTEKVLPHLESMEPVDLLTHARNVERYDFVARRNFGIADTQPGNGALSLNILTNQALVQVVEKSN